MVIGALGEDSAQTTVTNGPGASTDNTVVDSGAAYVFRRGVGTWVQEAYLKAPNAGQGDRFGASVAISGDTIVVGAPGEDSSGRNVVNGPTPTIAGDDNTVFSSGAAYVFKRSSGAWIREAYLKAPNSRTDWNFGEAVAISGDTIAVGADGDSTDQRAVSNVGQAVADNVLAANSGGAYVFFRVSGAWGYQAYLKAPNADPADRFGSAVSVSGDFVVVGAAEEGGSQSTIINSPTPVASDNLAASAGAAYVFRRLAGNWGFDAYLKAPNAEADDRFGDAVSIFGDTLVIGAGGEDSGQTTITHAPSPVSDSDLVSGAGAAYVYGRNAGGWSFSAYLKAPNANVAAGQFGSAFGRAVAISGDRIVVGARSEASASPLVANGEGAPADTGAVLAGAAFVFRRSATFWRQEAYLKAPNVGSGDVFGTAVAISGNTIVVGAPGEDSAQRGVTVVPPGADNGAADSGAAYVYVNQ